MSYNYRKHSTIHRSDGVVKIDGLFGWIVSGCTKSIGTKLILATTMEVGDLERF